MWRTLRTVFRRASFERDMDDEMRFHIELRAADLAARGLPPDEAARRARLEFGPLERQKDHARANLGLRVLDELRGDLRAAARTFTRDRRFAAVAIVTLALGIGANAAIFNLMNALALRVLPVARPQDLLMVTLAAPGTQEGDPSVSYPLALAIDARRDIFTGAAGFSASRFTVGTGASMAYVRGALVTGAFYETLGLRPIAGRLLTRADDRPGAPLVAVLTDGYWERAFARDPSIVGRALVVNGVPVEVIGVSPPGFTGATVGAVANLTLPVSAIGAVSPQFAGLLGAGNSWLRVLARPQPGIAPAEAAARLAAAWPQIVPRAIDPKWPADRQASIADANPLLVPGGTGWTYLRGIYVKPLRVLMGVVALVLLIACANVASLMLARAGARRKEIAVRLAIGAGRGRIVRQLLVESAALAIAGAAAGLLIARLAGSLIVDVISTPQAAIAFDLTPDWRVLAFTTAAALATALIFGLAPAWQATSPDAARALKDDTRTSTARSRLLPVLVAAQMALSLVLLIGAGLFVRTLRNLETLDAGFRPHGVLFVELQRRSGTVPLSVLDEIRALPGVSSASLSTHTPLSGATWSDPVVPAGQRIPERDTAVLIGASPGFFATLEMPLVAGREFAASDASGAPPVAIVNERYARRYFPGQNPVGQRLSGMVNGRPTQMQVVGLAKDANTASLRTAPPATVFVSYAQLQGTNFANVEIRTPASIPDLAPALQRILQPLQPNEPIEVEQLSSQVASTLAQERMMATLGTGFGLLALALASVGVYGLLAYGVTRRTREIGIRMSLGARPSWVIALVLRGALGPLLVGVAAGLPAAWALSRLVESLLFGLRGTDPGAIAGATLLLTLVALAAAWLPARRAARIDPLHALRHE